MNLFIQYIVIAFVLAGCVFLAVKYFRNTTRGGNGDCAGCALKNSCDTRKKGKKCDSNCGCH